MCVWFSSKPFKEVYQHTHPDHLGGAVLGLVLPSGHMQRQLFCQGAGNLT
ncbi:MAG: hypothetical protein VYE64_08965 [Planctomycetota bacterium]|nr:hypothetical protein [Planctomycetota bacterium]